MNQNASEPIVIDGVTLTGDRATLAAGLKVRIEDLNAKIRANPSQTLLEHLIDQHAWATGHLKSLKDEELYADVRSPIYDKACDNNQDVLEKMTEAIQELEAAEIPGHILVRFSPEEYKKESQNHREREAAIARLYEAQDALMKLHIANIELFNMFSGPLAAEPVSITISPNLSYTTWKVHKAEPVHPQKT